MNSAFNFNYTVVRIMGCHMKHSKVALQNLTCSDAHLDNLRNDFTGRMVRWLKKSSMETMSRASICIWFWSGSQFEPFIFLLFLPRNPDHVSFGRSGSLFLARKYWSGSKLDSFLPRIQFLFEFWAFSEFSN